jgi:hypothetical protein
VSDKTIMANLQLKHVRRSIQLSPSMDVDAVGGLVRIQAAEDSTKEIVVPIRGPRELFERVVNRVAENRPVALPANFFELDTEQAGHRFIWEILD